MTDTVAVTVPITVSGGAGGIAAQTADLRDLAGRCDTAGRVDAEVAVRLRGPVAAHAAQTGMLLAPGPFAAVQDALLELLVDLDDLDAALVRQGAGLRAAADAYEHADDSVVSAALAVLGHLALAVVDAQLLDLTDARSETYAALPDAASVAMHGLRRLESVYAHVVGDGHAVLHEAGEDLRTPFVLPPRTLADLIRQLAERDAGAHGEISVSLLTGTDGVTRAVVDVPGTKSWDPGRTPDVTSVGTDIRALAGLDSSYEHGIFAALRAAGVPPDMDVMLVGHSEGGIVAVDAARDATATGRFRITHVVTAGSPIGTLVGGLPPSVQVLALENDADLVPRTDAADNPPLANVTTVHERLPADDVGAEHGIETSYLPEAEAADASADPSIGAFVDSAAPFLEATEIQTQVFVITRSYR